MLLKTSQIAYKTTILFIYYIFYDFFLIFLRGFIILTENYTSRFSIYPSS